MIYLDNAATSFPKPPQVVRAMAGTLEKLGANPGRSGHRLSLCAGRVVHACREEAALLAGLPDASGVVFTAGCTAAIDLALRGMLHRGDEVLCSHAEHNAVMRLLHYLCVRGEISVKVLSPDKSGILQPHTLQSAIGPKTAMVVVSHASNVTGVIQPVSRLGAVCRENGVPLLVDAAQTAGVLDVSLHSLRADMVAMPGHKGLLGPQGVGMLMLRKGIEPSPTFYGGTGSSSESLELPTDLPDRYESGTLPLPAIAGMLAGMRFIRGRQAEIREYEEALNKRLRDGLENMKQVRCLGDRFAPSTGITSFVAVDRDSGEIADALDHADFAVRGGLHCAPSIHRWLGTLQSGAVRVSVGIYNTEDDVDSFLLTLERILRS